MSSSAQIPHLLPQVRSLPRAWRVCSRPRRPATLRPPGPGGRAPRCVRVSRRRSRTRLRSERHKRSHPPYVDVFTSDRCDGPRSMIQRVIARRVGAEWLLLRAERRTTGHLPAALPSLREGSELGAIVPMARSTIQQPDMPESDGGRECHGKRRQEQGHVRRRQRRDPLRGAGVGRQRRAGAPKRCACLCPRPSSSW